MESGEGKLKCPSSEHELTKTEFEAILNVITGGRFKDEESERKEGEWLKAEYETLLKMRWWKAVLHLQMEAKKNKDRYYRYSTIVIIFSSITTALSGLNFAGSTNILPIDLIVTTFFGNYLLISFDNVPLVTILRASIFILSLTVTIVVAIIKLNQYNEIYLKKFKYAERLKREGFKFFQLAGDYSNCKHSYNEAYPKFSENVESIINEINEIYVDLLDKKQQ